MSTARAPDASATVAAQSLADQTLLDSLVDLARFEPWFAEHVEPVEGHLQLKRISAGHTNELVLVTNGARRSVLRRPPRTTSAPTAHNMAREFRVLRALDGTDVPHPAAISLCEDVGVIGAPFMMMQHVDGIGASLPLPAPFDASLVAQRQMAFALVDTLGAIALVDWEAAGLDGFGKPAGFLERQVGRWMSQLAKYRTRDIPRIDDVAAWLEANRPESQHTGIIHGDYQWNNVMFGPDLPGRIVAVVDWEQSTIGDPLIDLGWLLGLWYEPDEVAVGRSADRLFCQLPGLPTRRDLADRYVTVTGWDLSDLRYYSVLALFKLACVIEGSYARHVAGTSDDPLHATFEVRVPALVERAASITEGEYP